MVGKTLTPMQLKFCKNVGLKDMTYSDAYRNSYNTENYKAESVNVKASELMSHVHILVRVEEYREQRRQAILKEEVYGYKEHMKELDNIKGLALTPAGDNGKVEISTAGRMVELKGKVSELYNFTTKQELINIPVMPVVKVDGEELEFKVGKRVE